MSDSKVEMSHLAQHTSQVLQDLEARDDGVDIEGRFSQLEQQMDEAAEIRDDRERDLRMKVLSADLEELRKDAVKEEEDLANAVFGLNAMLEQMGEEYLNLNQPSAEEASLVEAAEARLQNAEEMLNAAQRRRFFRQRAIEEAERDLLEAKQQLAEATKEAQRRARSRLLNADMEASLQEFMVRVERTVAIMEHRKAEIEKQLQAVSTKKGTAFATKEAAAKALEHLDQELNNLEDKLRIEEDHLDTLANGTPEHAQASQLVSDLRAQVEALRGKRNTAFVLFQSKEKFAAELEVHERTQMKLRDNQRMWITALRSDTEERIVTFKSRLEAMKAMSDQDIAKELDQLGAEVDQNNVAYMVRAGAVSDEIRMKRMESHPQRLAEVAAARAAQAEAIQRVRLREQKLIEQFKEQYGIDPTASSFFSYEEDFSRESGESF